MNAPLEEELRRRIGLVFAQPCAIASCSAVSVGILRLGRLQHHFAAFFAIPVVLVHVPGLLVERLHITFLRDDVTQLFMPWRRMLPSDRMLRNIAWAVPDYRKRGDNPKKYLLSLASRHRRAREISLCTVLHDDYEHTNEQVKRVESAFREPIHQARISADFHAFYGIRTQSDSAEPTTDLQIARPCEYPNGRSSDKPKEQESEDGSLLPSQTRHRDAHAGRPTKKHDVRRGDNDRTATSTRDSFHAPTSRDHQRVRQRLTHRRLPPHADMPLPTVLPTAFARK
jgi:hypothetical protein